jgi:hypothetical protein
MRRYQLRLPTVTSGPQRSTSTALFSLLLLDLMPLPHPTTLPLDVTASRPLGEVCSCLHGTKVRSSSLNSTHNAIISVAYADNRSLTPSLSGISALTRKGLTFASSTDNGKSWNWTQSKSEPFYAGGSVWLTPSGPGVYAPPPPRPRRRRRKKNTTQTHTHTHTHTQTHHVQTSLHSVSYCCCRTPMNLPSRFRVCSATGGVTGGQLRCW